LKILALITAREGSKRIPGKNIRILGGKPLMLWSADAVKNISEICDILVSTDGVEIAQIARDANLLVPWLRPLELSGDETSSVDVALHALDWYEGVYGKVDGLLLLQPTSPFRSLGTINKGISAFSKYELRPIVAVSAARSHPYWCFSIKNARLTKFCDYGPKHFRSQDLPPAYVLNGAFYLISPQDLRAKRSFYSDDMVPLVIDDPSEGLDIDTEWDWSMAEAVIGMRK
jgi:CMP-N,N'-diacetyllegionaminic acid synthase